MRSGCAFTYPDAESPSAATERLAQLVHRRELPPARQCRPQATSEFLDLAAGRRRSAPAAAGEEARGVPSAQRRPSADRRCRPTCQAMQTTQMQLQSLVESIAADRDRKVMVERLYADAPGRATELQPTAAPGHAGADPDDRRMSRGSVSAAARERAAARAARAAPQAGASGHRPAQAINRGSPSSRPTPKAAADARRQTPAHGRRR